MDQAIVARALAKYGIAYVSIRTPQKGYRNESFPVDLPSGDAINIIFYKSEPAILERIRNANAVADFLANHGFSARKTYSNKILTLRGNNYLKYAAVYNYLPGNTIPWEGYNQDHIKLLGKTMSDMHAALVALDRAELPDVADEYLAVVERMRRYFADISVQRALSSKLGLQINMRVFSKLSHLLTGSKLLPGKQSLHMDFVRSNILFEDKAEGDFKVRISGILDFEKAAYGHPLFDVARTLAFLLVDCKYKQPDKIRKYFLASGYAKRGKATLSDRYLGMLDPLMDLFLFHDFYKFLRHNPYEFLGQNEHFVRTRDLLITHGVVRDADS